MKSGIRRLRNAAAPSGPPVPLSAGRRNGLAFDLGAGKMSRETLMRTYGQSGTIYAIVSLLQQAAAAPRWHLYKKQPKDGRVRYTTGDQGSDQRVEVVNHAALSLWHKPNAFMSGFEFREGSNQHEELTGETFWVLDMDGTTFPTSMWYVRPDRLEPVPSPDDYLVGWIYTGPNGEQIPLQLNEVIQEKLPNPLDPFRGAGPIASILSNIQQQKYATDYQRNLFINGADPGGIIQVGDAVNRVKLTDRDFDEMTMRWRESHQGIARAGRVGVLENGATWIPSGQTNKDLEYGNLRLANRDEMREAFRMHKAMLGTVEDVNRANAQTAEETFGAWQELPRLERRRDTLNHKLLPLFGDQTVEFDFEDPSPVNQEAAVYELLTKAQAAAALVNAGFDPSDVCETVGLPDMDVVEKATQQPALPPGWVAGMPGGPAVPAGGDGADAPNAANADMAALLRRVLNDGYVPVESGRRLWRTVRARCAQRGGFRTTLRDSRSGTRSSRTRLARHRSASMTRSGSTAFLLPRSSMNSTRCPATSRCTCTRPAVTSTRAWRSTTACCRRGSAATCRSSSTAWRRLRRRSSRWLPAPVSLRSRRTPA